MQLVYKLIVDFITLKKIKHSQSRNDKIKPVGETIFFREFEKLSYFEEK